MPPAGERHDVILDVVGARGSSAGSPDSGCVSWNSRLTEADRGSLARGGRQNDADGERSGNQQSKGHTVAEPRTRLVSMASGWCIGPGVVFASCWIASVNRGRKKKPFQCEAAHTVSPKDGANEDTEQSCCFSHEGDRIRSSHPLSPAPEPRRFPLAGVLFWARDTGRMRGRRSVLACLLRTPLASDSDR
jgi:hypothetical protein